MDTLLEYLVSASLLTTFMLPPIFGVWLMCVSCTMIGPLGRLKYPDWQIEADPVLKQRNEWRKRDGRMLAIASVTCFITTGLVWFAIWRAA